jgi:hypothetical protein
MHPTLQLYATDAPNNQATVDIFKDTWSSQLPGGLRTGTVGDSFNDPRVALAHREFDFEGKTVLELGPMEAGHTYGIHNLGASSITAIEANANGFLKCLMVKEFYRLDRARFLYGDFVKFLEQTEERFDIIFASGVLYHMAEPLKLLSLIKRHTDKCYIWTGFYDREVMAPAYGERFSERFPGPIRIEHDGFKCEGYPQHYLESLNFQHYSGGSGPGSVWLTKDDILAFLRHVGFKKVETYHIDTSYGYAPRFSVVAEA